MSDETLSGMLLKIRYDCTAIQGKVSSLLTLVNALNLDEVPLRMPNVNGPVTAAGCADCGCGAGAHTDDCEAA